MRTPEPKTQPNSSTKSNTNINIPPPHLVNSCLFPKHNNSHNFVTKCEPQNPKLNQILQQNQIQTSIFLHPTW
uniref:Putative ovule protein n=1 Tax=Solanum chacoense TaxID=4108 RepID=A0A0V0GHM1_SOLCH